MYNCTKHRKPALFLFLPEEAHKGSNRVWIQNHRGIGDVRPLNATIERDILVADQDTSADERGKRDLVRSRAVHTKQVSQATELAAVLVDNHLCANKGEGKED